MMHITGRQARLNCKEWYDQIAAAREAVGPKIDILVDMHGRYDAVTGTSCSKKIGAIKPFMAGRTNTC